MSHDGLKELAYRSQNGLEVRLLLEPARTKCLSMASTGVDDDGFRLTVAGRATLDAFNLLRQLDGTQRGHRRVFWLP